MLEYNMYDIEQLVDSIVSESFPNFRYREHQKETVIKALDAFLNQSKKIVLIEAGTGLGKSWIARIIAEVMNKYYLGLYEQDEMDKNDCESLFLTKTISLQNQYLHDFPEMKKLMGATNYSCHCKDPHDMPAVLPHMKHHATCRYTVKDGMCDYHAHRMIYKKSPLKCLNYAFFFAGSVTYATGGLLVCDEAHSLPEYLVEAASVTLNFDRLVNIAPGVSVEQFFPISEIRKTNDLHPEHILGIYKYASECLNKLIAKKEELEQYAKSLPEDSESLKNLLLKSLNPIYDKIEYLTKLCSGLYNYVKNQEGWIINKVDSERDLIFRLKPLEVQPAHLNLVTKAKNILLMTATGKRLAKDLKLDKSQMEIIDVPYVWPLDNRPIIVSQDLPPLSYSNREVVLPRYVKAIDDILEQVGDEDSGIIHTSSYYNAEYLKSHTKYSDRIYVPESEEIRHIKDLIVPGRFIASPAILEGISLDGDESRIQIFMKVPYPSLGDPWISAKSKLDREWYDYQTLLSIVQGSGRSIRSKDDFAVTFMLDTSFINLYKRGKWLLPDWFIKTLIF